MIPDANCRASNNHPLESPTVRACPVSGSCSGSLTKYKSCDERGTALEIQTTVCKYMHASRMFKIIFFLQDKTRERFVAYVLFVHLNYVFHCNTAIETSVQESFFFFVKVCQIFLILYISIQSIGLENVLFFLFFLKKVLRFVFYVYGVMV